MSKAKQIKNLKGERRKLTGADGNDDDRKHQDDPFLVMITQDPSPPDHNSVSDNILSQIPVDGPSQGSVQGCSRGW